MKKQFRLMKHHINKATPSPATDGLLSLEIKLNIVACMVFIMICTTWRAPFIKLVLLGSFTDIMS